VRVAEWGKVEDSQAGFRLSQATRNESTLVKGNNARPDGHWCSSG
jgi:hypothetical protein